MGFKVSLSLPSACGSDTSSQLLLQHHAYLSVAMLSAMMVMDSNPRELGTRMNFLLQSALVMFYHNQKVARTVFLFIKCNNQARVMKAFIVLQKYYLSYVSEYAYVYVCVCIYV